MFYVSGIILTVKMYLLIPPLKDRRFEEKNKFDKYL